MSGPLLAILLTFLVHVVGALVLIWTMAGRESLTIFRTQRDDDGGQRLDPPPEPVPGPSGDALSPPLLTDAESSPVRLREPGRIGERYPQRPRRPDHAPAPAREPERV